MHFAVLSFPFSPFLKFCFSLTCFSMPFDLCIISLYILVSFKVKQVIFSFSAFKSTAFRRDKFIPRPQCLAFPTPPLSEWASDAAQAYLGHILVAVKVYSEILAILSCKHSTCSLILTISMVCLEIRIYSLVYHIFSGIKNEPEVNLIAK